MFVDYKNLITSNVLIIILNSQTDIYMRKLNSLAYLFKMLTIICDVNKALNDIFKRFTISIIFLFLYGMVQGQTTFLNRPSKAESAIVLEKGVWQFESAYEIELTGLEDEREKEILFLGISLRYGLGWGIELRLANQYKTFSDRFVSINGFNDIDIGTKIKLLRTNDEDTEIAFISHFLLPTGSNGISNERVGNESLLLVWHGLTEKLGIEYNIGYNNF